MITLVEAFVLGSLIVLLVVCLIGFYQTLKVLKRVEARIELLEQEISQIQNKTNNLERALALVCELQKLLVETKEKEFKNKHDLVKFFISS